MKTYKFIVNNKTVEVVTIKGLAEKSERSAIAIRKLIEREILPEANFRGTPIVHSKGQRAGVKYKGQSYYTVALADVVADYIKKNFKRGSKVTLTQKAHLKKLFEKEKQLLGI